MSVQIRKRYAITHMSAERGGYGLSPSTRLARASTHATLKFLIEFLIEFLRDCSTDSVETAVKTMLAKAASRSLDILEIRCDGEGAVGALIAAIEQRGLRVSIAGPGQHVSVMDRMAQTIKSRLRYHELAPPFVMTHTLIV